MEKTAAGLAHRGRKQNKEEEFESKKNATTCIHAQLKRKRQLIYRNKICKLSDRRNISTADFQDPKKRRRVGLYEYVCAIHMKHG